MAPAAPTAPVESKNQVEEMESNLAAARRDHELQLARMRRRHAREMEQTKQLYAQARLTVALALPTPNVQT